MNWEITFSAATPVIKVKVWNELTVSDIRRMLDDVLAHERWYPGCAILYNYDDLDVSLTSTREVGLVRDVYHEYRDRCEMCKTALLGGSLLRYGLARQFQSLSGLQDAQKLQVFRVESEALAWLGTRLIEDANRIDPG